VVLTTEADQIYAVRFPIERGGSIHLVLDRAGVRQVPLYYFGVRTGSGNLFDKEGIELPNVEAAREYAGKLARELMYRNEPKKRHWWVRARDVAGKELFALPFVAVDETIRHLKPEIRQLIEQNSKSRLALAEAIFASRMTILRARATIARARSRLYVAAYNGHSVLGYGSEGRRAEVGELKIAAGDSSISGVRRVFWTK
jgi:hypothetical protein